MVPAVIPAAFGCSTQCAKLCIWNSWYKLLSKLSFSTSSRHCVHNSEFQNCVFCILGQNCQFCILPRTAQNLRVLTQLPELCVTVTYFELVRKLGSDGTSYEEYSTPLPYERLQLHMCIDYQFT